MHWTARFIGDVGRREASISIVVRVKRQFDSLERPSCRRCRAARRASFNQGSQPDQLLIRERSPGSPRRPRQPHVWQWASPVRLFDSRIGSTHQCDDLQEQGEGTENQVHNEQTYESADRGARDIPVRHRGLPGRRSRDGLRDARGRERLSLRPLLAEGRDDDVVQALAVLAGHESSNQRFIDPALLMALRADRGVRHRFALRPGSSGRKRSDPATRRHRSSRRRSAFRRSPAPWLPLRTR